MTFDLQAHRGGAGLAPENSLHAFGTALDLGVSTLELDVHVSADGVPVPRGRPTASKIPRFRWPGCERAGSLPSSAQPICCSRRTVPSAPRSPLVLKRRCQ